MTWRNLLFVFAFILAVSCWEAYAQQLYRMPDVKTMKHLTSKASDHAQDIPGNETSMDFYSAPDGTIFTVYSFRGRTVVFSTHSNSDVQNTYKVYMDMMGNGMFQEINRSVQWQLPPWSRQ